MIRRFLRDESGATAIEYALMATLMGVALIAAFISIGDSLSGNLNNAAAPLK